MVIPLETIDLQEIDNQLDEEEKDTLKEIDDHLEKQAKDAQERYDNFDDDMARRSSKNIMPAPVLEGEPPKIRNTAKQDLSAYIMVTGKGMIL